MHETPSRSRRRRPQGRPAQRRVSRRRWRYVLAGGLAALALLAGGLAYIKARSEPAVAVATLTAGRVEVIAEAEALVLRTEQVHTAPAAGTVRHLVRGGQRVRVGTPVAEIVSDPGPAIPVPAAVSGVIAFETDGLEAALSPGQQTPWTPSRAKTLPTPVPRAIPEGRTAAGEPLFKVVESLELGLIALPPDRAVPPGLQAGAEVQLRFPWNPSAQVPARVTAVARDGEGTLIQLAATNFPAQLAGVRRVRVTMLFASYEGLVAPRTAVGSENGVPGVWLADRGQPVFTPVRIIGGNETFVALETDLPEGSRILTAPPPEKP